MSTVDLSSSQCRVFAAQSTFFAPDRAGVEHANYSGGSVRDSGGNNVEAVCHLSEEPTATH